MWVAGALVLLAALVTGAWFLGNALGGDDPEDPSVAGESEPGQEAVDHTAEATAKAPRTAPPNVDVDGNPTSYDASNMLDGVPETAWRAAGDGSGLKIVFTFPERTRITEVGLINGYAKEASDESGATFDWYTGHRRIEQVTWNFGVGDVVRQDLEDDRGVQTVEVGRRGPQGRAQDRHDDSSRRGPGRPQLHSDQRRPAGGLSVRFMA